MAMGFCDRRHDLGTPLLAAFSNHHSLANQCPTYKLAIKREIFLKTLFRVTCENEMAANDGFASLNKYCANVVNENKLGHSVCF